MKLKLKNFTPAIVLGAICLVVAALLAVINHFTAPVIEENERIARTASLRAVFGEEGESIVFDEPLASLPEGTPETVTEIYKEKNGDRYAVLLSTQGYAGEMTLTVGVSEDGTVAGVVITKSNETKDKDKVAASVTNLVGETKDGIDGVTLVTGATVSSNAVKGAVTDALEAIELVRASGTVAQLTSTEEIPEPTDADIIAKGRELMPSAEGFELVDTSNAGFSKGVKQIYKETSGKGYLVFCRTATQYNSRETEVVFTVDGDLNVSGFDIIYWTLSPSYQAEVNIYEDHADVKRFEESFIGTNVTSVGQSVDLVSKATSTTYNIFNAVTEALDYLDTDIHARIIASAKALMPDAVGFELVDTGAAGFRKGARYVYRETTGKGYAVYCHTATQYNLDETRFVVSLDADCTVTGIDLWRWSTGIYEGATKPGDPAIDTLLESIVGTNKTEFAHGVDLITAATGTSGNIMAAVAEAVNYLDADLEGHILSSAREILTDADGFTLLDTAGAGFTKGVRRIYRENSGKGYAVYAMTKTQYNSQETEFVFVLDKNFKVVGFDLWFWSTGTYDGMTGTDAPEVDLLEKSFVGVNDLNIDLRVDLVSGATGTTNNVKAAVLEAIDYLDPPSEVNGYKIAATVVFFAGIIALGVAIYFQRRRRI